MSLTRRLLTLASLGVVATAAPSYAGWNNVFLTACNDCEPRTSQKSQLPPTRTSMKYESTSYYETVTVMRPEKYIEEVPVKVKSYYYEPVTTYTYRSYYDSCSGQCQQIAVPRTSQVRREECNTVMKAVERMKMVPVQVQREVTESRPVYTSYGPVTSCLPAEASKQQGTSDAFVVRRRDSFAALALFAFGSTATWAE